MSKSKQKTQNKVAWSTPPTTQATQNLQSMVDTPADYATPIRNSYARARRENDRSYANPLGAYTTADVRDKAKRAQNFDFAQSEAADLANAAMQTNADKFNRQSAVAQLTQPRMYNSQSTSSQPVTAWDVIGLGTNAATSALS